ncbi:hypothetical protein ACHAXR_003548 [Thalassiosira sp. AJA248-18]
METNQTLALLAVLLFITSTWTVFHYAKRRTSIFILLLSVISFGLGSAAVALLPIDLSYASAALSNSTNSNNNNSDGGEDDIDNKNYASKNPTYFPWQVTYWTTFFLAWLVLPITRESLLSGHFTLRQRIKNGLSRSFRSIFLMFCMGIISIIAMAIHLKSAHIVTIVLPVLMALGNTYGLLLVSLLLGNGLINIPKKFWREACPANELRRARIMACGAEEELFEAVMGLEDVEDKIEEVCQTAVSLREGENSDLGIMENENGDVALGTPRRGRRATRCGICCRVDEVTEFHECLEVLVKRKNETVDLCSERRTRRGTSRRSSTDTDSDDNNDEINTMDIKYLVSLSCQLKKAQERVTSAQLRWNHLMEHSRLFSALMDDGIQSTGSNDEGDGGTNTNLLSSSSAPGCCHKVRYSLQRFWVRCLRYPTYRCISIISAVLSVFVLVSEVTIAASLNLSPFSWILHAVDDYDQNSTTQILFQIAALVPLLYMSICVYTCLFQMSLLGPYCLRGGRQSNGVALVFNAQYLVRLQFPLGYNYLLMLKYDMTHCAFHTIMSDMATIPFFGTSFSVYAPLLILAVCLFTLCDFYPKILRFLGIEHEDALLLGDEEELDGKVNDGIQLMKRDAERRVAGGVASSPEKQSLNGRRNIIV